jgi:hypothetical protein
LPVWAIRDLRQRADGTPAEKVVSRVRLRRGRDVGQTAACILLDRALGWLRTEFWW